MPDNVINQKLDEALEGIVKAQEISDRNKERLDTLDKEQIERINEAVTKNLDGINKLQAANEETVKTQKELEKKLCRPGATNNSDICSESKASFLQYLRRGEAISKEVTEEIAESIARKSLLGATEHQIDMCKKDLVVGNNPRGGYFVRPEVADFMIKRIFETSPMRQISNIVTISTESLEIPIDDNEADSGWVGEANSRPNTNTPDVGMEVIHTHEIYAQPRVSQKMVDDAGFDIETWVQTKVADRFRRQQNTAFVSGAGSKKPRGFLTYPAWAAAGVYERGKIEQRNSGTSGDFDADNMIDLQTDLLEDYQADAVWTMKRKTFAKVMTLKATGDGQYLLNPNVLSEGANKILLGKPVFFFEDMPTIAADALAVAYGNFKEGYTIVDRIGIRVKFDDLTEKPYILYYTTQRVGGAVTNFQSIKILKLAV